MKTSFDLTMPDFTKIRLLAQLNNIRAQLYVAGDLVGGEKIQDAIDHIQSDIDFSRDAQSMAIHGWTEVI